MGRQNAFELIKEIGVIPAIRPSTATQAIHAAEAIRKGGIPIVEISMAVASGISSLRLVREALGNDLLLGAGSVIDEKSVTDAYAAGVDFIVTSGYSWEVVKAAKDHDLPILVGALTPTEVQLAATCKPEAVKLFPCYAVGGARYVKSLRSQYPQVQLIASGGVVLENCAEYLRAGACAVGVGGEIGDSESMATGDHRLFTERAKRFRRMVIEARSLWRGARPSQTIAPVTLQ